MAITTTFRPLAVAALASFLSLPSIASPTSLPKECSNSSSLSIQLKNGLTILGATTSLTPNVEQYLGIPYATPPLSSLRFTAPLPYIPIDGTTINGTSLPKSCMQYRTFLQTMVTVETPYFELGDAGLSEDCLTVSVWTPKGSEGRKLPVVIWIFGGGFVTGGTDVPWQIPAQWVERSGEHVVVSINYRVNIFGFPNAAGLDTQNLGLLDQRLGVEWIQQNIASFGGDPKNMVLWGQSAGGMSVDLYNYAYRSDPIVSGLIMDSGMSHLNDLRSYDFSHSNFTFVAEKVGCADQVDSDAELECMRGIDAQVIEDFLHGYQDARTTPAVSFVPITDGVVVFENYTQQALDGAISDLPAIIGFNQNEGYFLLPYSPTGQNQTLVDELSYMYFWCPTIKTVNDRLSAGVITHRYFYHGNFTNISRDPWMGAVHGSEMPLIFGTHSNYNSKSTPFEYAVSHKLQDYWLAFAKSQSKGLVAKGWAPYEGAGGTVKNFAKGGVVAQSGDTRVIEETCGALGYL